MKVTAQINSGDPCPKNEYDAWDYETQICNTLEECIYFLIDQQADGFIIEDNDGKIILESTQTHSSSVYDKRNEASL